MQPSPSDPVTSRRWRLVARVGIPVLVAAGIVVGSLALARPEHPVTTAADSTASEVRGPSSPTPVTPAPVTPAPVTPSAAPTPAPAATVPTTYAGRVSAFGDSVILGASQVMRTAVPKLDVTATVGIQSDLVLSRVRAAKAAGSLAPVVVIHTGNNGTVDPSDLDATLDLLADRATVVLVNDCLPRGWVAANNTLLARAVTAHPNVVLFDWNRLATGRPRWFGPDQVHPVDAGRHAYSAALVRLLNTVSTGVRHP